jgi:pre-mRNA-splicing factor ATP-dependent RNA helicase DHX38/PRP16
MTDADFSQESEPTVEITTQHLKPPFLDDSVIFSRQNDPVSSVRDPEGDLALHAKKGSFVVQQRRIEKERRNKAQDSTNLKGTAMGRAIGLRDDSNEDRETREKKVEEVIPDFETIQKQRRSLPAYHVKDDLLRMVRDNQVVIVIGETGSGKTTQLTQFLNEDGYGLKGVIACTQPRRVAAMSVAKRVSQEMGVGLGAEVGYSIRFEDVTSDKTRIKYMTEGILLRETLMDKDLDKYSCVIMDEAHERSLNTDVLLGLFRNLLMRRNNLKLIITSATMNADRFSQFFGNAPQFHIPGRTFPVDIMFSKYSVDDYVEQAVKQAITVHLQSGPGDILIFMTGQEDIDITCDLIQERLSQLDDPSPLDVLPMYSTLPVEQQIKIFQPSKPGHRKCVVCTNIAETSLTVDGVKFVIDTGYSKMKVYNPKLGMESLLINPIAQANAQQRTGRAGRTSHGSCYRLYTEKAFREEMYVQQIPEIQRTNLANTLLLLKSLGINDLLKFPFLDAPPRDTVTSSLYELWSIGALDNFGQLTQLGCQMTKFPLLPSLSKLLLISSTKGCSKEMITIVSMLSVPSCFIRPKERQQEADKTREHFNIPESDHLTLLNVYNQWELKRYNELWCKQNFINSRSLKKARDIKEQLEEIMKQSGLKVESTGYEWDVIRQCITSGYFHHAAKRDGLKEFVNLRNGMKLVIHPTSALYDSNDLPEYVVFHELMLTTREYISVVTAVDPYWLIEYGSVFYRIRKEKRKIEDVINEDKKKWEEQKAEKNEKRLKKNVVNVGSNKGRRRRGF